MLTHIFRSHNVKVGYEGLFADDVEVFNGPYDQPTFNFNSLLDLARDNVFTETGMAYNPVTGEKTQYRLGCRRRDPRRFLSKTHGRSPES